MSYARLDSATTAWVERHSFTLFSGGGRCVYLSHSDECCQIWIEEPTALAVQIHAAAVDARNDEEMRMDWEVPLPEFVDALENAVVSVPQWFAR